MTGLELHLVLAPLRRDRVRFETWAETIVSNHPYAYCQSLRLWWRERGRELHGSRVSCLATSALTLAIARQGK